jgi:hypothetical protein
MTSNHQTLFAFALEELLNCTNRADTIFVTARLLTSAGYLDLPMDLVVEEESWIKVSVNPKKLGLNTIVYTITDSGAAFSEEERTRLRAWSTGVNSPLEIIL